MEINDLKKEIDSTQYRNTLIYISKQSGIELNDFINVTILNIGLKIFNASGLGGNIINQVLENDNDLFSRFCINRINGFKNKKFEQEYPEGEELEEDDDSEDENETLSLISLISYIVEFYFLKNKNETDLRKYLKKIRIPNYENHLNEIKEFLPSR